MPVKILAGESWPKKFLTVTTLPKVRGVKEMKKITERSPPFEISSDLSPALSTGSLP
jgi:hypothetical protein